MLSLIQSFEPSDLDLLAPHKAKKHMHWNIRALGRQYCSGPRKPVWSKVIIAYPVGQVSSWSSVRIAESRHSEQLAELTKSRHSAQLADSRHSEQLSYLVEIRPGLNWP